MIVGWFDDIAIGEERVTEGRTITEADIVGFAALSGDWHPLHTNVEHAQAGPYGQRIGHGLLGLSVATGLATLDRETVLAFYGIDRLRFVSPTFIGDTVHVRSTVAEKRDRDDRSGTVTCQMTVVNQRDEVVLAAAFLFLVARKGAQ